ncbi:hypothetical protein TKK_0008477 [Trichogramma kaykai]
MPFVPSDFNLGIIKSLWLDQYDNETIAGRLNCSVKTVKRWSAKFRENPGLVVTDRRHQNPGRFLKISEANLQRVINRIEDNPFLPVNRWPEELNLGVIEKTLRTAIKKRTEIRFRIAQIKPLLNAKNIAEPRLVRLPYPVKRLDLKDRVETSWANLFDDLLFFQNLTDSMPRRLRKVIEAGGEHIDY